MKQVHCGTSYSARIPWVVFCFVFGVVGCGCIFIDVSASVNIERLTDVFLAGFRTTTEDLVHLCHLCSM